MGIPKDYYKNLFSKKQIKINKNNHGCGISINVNYEKLGKKLDYAQDELDAVVWRDMKQYMPMDTGNLISETDMINKSVRGEVYLYPPESDYGHYMYEGWKYEDPLYKIGAFYKDGYGYWSRPGVEKVKSETPLFYSRESAEAHWDEVAYQNHHKEWVNVAKRSMK